MITEQKRDILDIPDKYWRCVTTNGVVKDNGECVMGAGVAKAIKGKYPEVPRILGQHIKMWGNIVWADHPNKLIYFPVKHKWWQMADLKLIESSTKQLFAIIEAHPNWFANQPIFLPRPGCGNGKLSWDDVKQVIEPLLHEQVVIIYND